MSRLEEGRVKGAQSSEVLGVGTLNAIELEFQNP